MIAGDKRHGTFITIEGGEGGGKSTQAKALVKRLRDACVDTILTREPGGTPGAELIRAALLGGSFEMLGARAEAVLFAAARIDHLDVKIRPALEAGTWVVSDRFHDSTRAYQGADDGVDPAFLERLEQVSLGGLLPNLTLILDLPARLGLARAQARRAALGTPDRFEKQSVVFHERLRQAFVKIAACEPARCVLVDATQAPEDVEQSIWDAVAHRLSLPSPSPTA